MPAMNRSSRLEPAPAAGGAVAPLLQARTDVDEGAAEPRVVRREDLTAPFTEEPEVGDLLLYQDPADAATSYFIPTYRLAEQLVGDRLQYLVAFTATTDGGALEIHLTRRRPDGLPADTRELPHVAGVALSYATEVSGGGTIEESHDLDVVPTDEGCVATLRMTGLAMREEVHLALVTPAARPRLSVSRTATLAHRFVPQPSGSQGGPPTTAAGDVVIDVLALSPQARWGGAQLTDPSGNSRNGVDLPFNGSDGDARGFVLLRDPGTMEDGTARRALATHPMWVDEGTIKGWHPDVQLPRNARFRAEVGFFAGARHTDGATFIVFEHHDEGGRRRWNEVLRHRKRYTGQLDHLEADLSHLADRPVGLELRVDAGPSSGQDWAGWVDARIVGEPPVPLYLERSANLTEPNVLPLRAFDRELHGYIFEGANPGGGQGSQLAQHAVSFEGVTHTYYQRRSEPNVFLILPDAYKLGRRPRPPRSPALTVRFISPDGSGEDLQAELSFVAPPVVDERRLDAATEVLRRTAPGIDPAQPISFRMMQTSADRLTLRVVMPGAGGRIERLERPGALSALDREITDFVTLPLDGFQAVFDALVSGGPSLLFTGEVLVHVGESTDHVVPFSARMDDLTGPLLEVEEGAAGGGRVRLSLRNVTESPVRVASLPVELVAAGGDRSWPASTAELTLGGAAVELPIELQPEAVLNVIVAPLGDPPADTTAVEATYDLSGVRALPDREAILRSVLDMAVPAPVTRTITVEVLGAFFDAHAEVQRVVVDLRGGPSIHIDRAEQTYVRTAKLPMSAADLVATVLGDPTGEGYQYRATVFDALGASKRSPWLEETSTYLIPDLTGLVGVVG